MLTLYTFPGGYGLPSVSPFCTKTVVLLKLSGLEHEVKPGDPRATPHGKLPCLRHEGGLVPDSGLIEEWLREHQGVDLDAHLDASQRALGHLIRRTLEENVYWILLYSRWIDEDGWAHQGPIIKNMMPALVRAFMPALIRRGVRKSLVAHGIGRHPPEGIYAAGAADLRAIEARIEGPFFFGEELSSCDITLLAFVGAILENPGASALKSAAEDCPKLVALVSAVEAKYRA